MRTDRFDFELPESLIAQHPSERRDGSRLLVLRRESGAFEHRAFDDLPELLQAGDLLVRNDSRVVPARLIGTRESTGGHWEGLFLRDEGDAWELMAQTRGRPKAGEVILVDGGLRLELLERLGGGHWRVRALDPGATLALLERFGRVPLPPYIVREGGGSSIEDRERYQTVYAAHPGSVAAPTAGLHFTEGIFERLRGRGVGVVDVTLHVGPGTFRPIKAEAIEAHEIHAEWASLSAVAADRLNAARAAGGRIVAVGTTAARVLETAVDDLGAFRPFVGMTRVYLRPGVSVRGLDALVTNFHLPRSSLLVLVSALAGVDAIRAAYAEAVARGYRFYSFGDAMLIA